MTTIITVIGILGSILGILEYIITIKEKINRAIDSLKLPKELDFYFLSFFALVSAASGGFVWNTICGFFGSKCPYVGGTQSEPHGWLAILWPLASMSIVIITLVAFNVKFHLIKIVDQLKVYSAFMCGMTIGSIAFYDFPLLGSIGFRNYFDQINTPFLDKEFGLVLLWSSLIATFGFLFMVFIQIKIEHKPLNAKATVLHLLEQIGLCVGLTTFAVAFCLLAFPNEARFDTARGIIAGLALRMSLFFGLLISHVPISEVTPPYIRHILRVKDYVSRRIPK